MGFIKKYFRKEKAAPVRERIVITDERFGECVLEKEESSEVWMLMSPQKTFGRHEDVEIELEVPEEKRGEALCRLAEVYEKQEAYLEIFYKGVLSFCDEWEETDADGNAITMENVKKNSSLFRIQIKESWKGGLAVSLNGMISGDNGEDLLGCHSVITEINCETGEIEHDLEG